jgi:hypothetical protein
MTTCYVQTLRVGPNGDVGLEQMPDPSGEGFYYRMVRTEIPIAQMPTENVWHNPRPENDIPEVVQIIYGPVCNYHPTREDGSLLDIAVITGQQVNAMGRRDSMVSVHTLGLLRMMSRDQAFLAGQHLPALDFSYNTMIFNIEGDHDILTEVMSIPSVAEERAAKEERAKEVAHLMGQYLIRTVFRGDFDLLMDMILRAAEVAHNPLYNPQ